MKALARNKQTLYYATYSGLESDYDAYGNYTGQLSPSYSSPVEVRMNISPAKGTADLEQFGISEQYDKVLVTDDMDCPITETSILWIDTTPGTTENPNPYNYAVVRVAKSLNSISFAVRKVDVNE